MSKKYRGYDSYRRDEHKSSVREVGREYLDVAKEVHERNRRYRQDKNPPRKKRERTRDSDRSSNYNYLRTPVVNSLSSSQWDDDEDGSSGFKKPRLLNERFTPAIYRDDENDDNIKEKFKSKYATPSIPPSSRSEYINDSPEGSDNDIDEMWYNLDGENDPYRNVSDVVTNKKKLQLQQAAGNRFKNRHAAYAMEREEAGRLWENKQLFSSGAAVQYKFNLQIDDEDNGRGIIHLHVHNILPPFLDGRIIFTKQFEPIIPVKDESSDMAKIAKNGSAMVKYFRDVKEKAKMAKQRMDISGTALGNLMGMEVVEKQDNWSESNYKDSMKYQDKIGKNTMDLKQKLKIDEQRKKLPIFKVRRELLRLIRENQILVIVGETGSGKTTQLTQYLYEEGYQNRGMIGCTQPRRVAAVSVAKRVADEVGTDLGQKVGYSIRFEDCKSEQTVIKYMTDGILLRESLRDEGLEDYSVIIMDEAHERTLNTDILFGILKQIVQSRNDLHLIVTSATMDADKFSRFFGNCAVFKIPGRTYPVDVQYEKSSILDPVAASVHKAVEIHLGSAQNSGDILVFMPGQEDVEVTCSKIREILEVDLKEKEPAPLMVEPLYSQLSSDRQSQVFRVESGGPRRCIVATNIAETSITLDGIRYVIDNGYCKMKVFNSRVGMDSLQVYPISQASANQRAGRAGRTGPGICSRMYTANQYENDLLPMTVPEIQRTNLTNVVLLLKSLKVNDLMKFPFMDSPPHDNILNSLYQLWMLGALDNTGHLTSLGARMSEFPLEPTLSKMLLTAVDRGCSDEMLTIVSMLSVPSIYSRPMAHQDEADQAHERFQVAESDHLTLLNIYRLWRRANYSTLWCKRNFVHHKSMKRVREVRTQLREIMDRLKMLPLKSSDDESELRYCICSAYFSQACKWKGIGEYVNLRTGVVCHLHPTSALYNMAFSADYVVYHELLMTTREYMNYVTYVDAHWLAELGYMFYSVKRAGMASGSTRTGSSTREMVQWENEMEQKMESEMKKAESERVSNNDEKELRIRQAVSERMAEKAKKQAARNTTGSVRRNK